jgi:hypothetical protein
MEVRAMFRRCCSLLMFTVLLGTLMVSGGCTTCQSCDDYCGSYYGGQAGDWVHQSGRAGSIHTHETARVEYDESWEEPMTEAPADAYYP